MSSSRTEYTPGPWSADEVRHGYDQVIRNAERDPVALVVIAGYTKSRGRANAHVRAASPDLHLACKFAASVFKAQGINGRPIELSERMALEKLEAAISKSLPKEACND